MDYITPTLIILLTVSLFTTALVLGGRYVNRHLPTLHKLELDNQRASLELEASKQKRTELEGVIEQQKRQLEFSRKEINRLNDSLNRARREIDHLQSLELYWRFRDAVRITDRNPYSSPFKDSNGNDYEAGLRRVIEILPYDDSSVRVEFEGLKQRLIENLVEEQRYGSTPEIKSSRSRILDSLEEFVVKHTNKSFYSLCR
jgi:hypothetical protein